MQKQKFFKQQFLNYQKFKNYKDLLNSILNEDTLYSIKEVENILKNYFKEVI